MTYICPKDPTHLSDDPDYCSVCGAKIAGSIPTASLTPPDLGAVGPTGTACPDCGTLRVGGAKFCEVCRHDFGSGASGNIPAAPMPPVPLVTDPDPPRINLSPDPAPQPLPVPIAAASILHLEAVAVADFSLYTDPDPAVTLPTDEPARTFPLDLAENLIGRRSDKRDIHPEIPLTDPGVSHRHAKLLRESNGTFTLLDVGSANGTQLNGKEVPAGVRTPVATGDEITLGCWTRITLRESGAVA